MSAQSWENAGHDSEDEDECESGSDDGSALAGSGSDAEEGDDADMSPQRDIGEEDPTSPERAIKRSVEKSSTHAKDEDEIVSSPSAPPSPRTPLSPLSSPAVKSAIFAEEHGDSSDNDEKEGGDSSVCAQYGEDDDGDESDWSLSQQPLWD